MKRNLIIIGISLIVIAAIIATATIIGNLSNNSGDPIPSPTAPAGNVVAPDGDVVPFDKEVIISPNPNATPTPLSTADATATATPSNVKTQIEYDFDTFIANANTLKNKFSANLAVTTIGTSEFGREIVCLQLGSANAKNKILMVAGVKGSEYGSSLIMMKQIETYLTNYKATYNKKTYEDIFNSCCIYFVPMLNPDGVELSIKSLESVPADKQAGVKAIFDASAKAGLISSDYTHWEANGTGIDVSINFGAGTVSSANIQTVPSSKNYPGEAFASKEAAAIKNLCEQNEFLLATVYSGSGNFVDWSFGQENDVVPQIYANLTSKQTGYTKLSNGPTPAECLSVSLSQWFISAYNKAGMTLMVGSGDSTPYTLDDLNKMWDSLSVLPLELALQGNPYETDITPNPSDFAPATATPTPNSNIPDIEYGEFD